MLNANDLLKEQEKTKQEKKKIYKEILERCYSKIKQANSKNETHLIYRISLIIPGMPLFDVDYAVKYLIHKLKKGNFQCFRIDFNAIMINWART